MQTLKNFIRATLILEADDDAENSNVASEATIGAVEALSGAADDPKYAAKVAALNELLVTKQDDIAADVNASLFQLPGGDGPGSLLSDNDMFVMRQTIAHLLESDLSDGLAYPYRTALFLTGFEKGITTYEEILDTAVKWGFTVSVGPIQYALDAITSNPTGGDPDELAELGWGVVGVGGTLTAVGLAKHFAGHFIAEKAAKMVTTLPIVGDMWKSFSRQRMSIVVNNPNEWQEVISAVEKGTARERSGDLTASIIRPILSYREGVAWTKFSSIKSVVNQYLIGALNDTAGKEIKVAVLQGDVGGQNSKQIGTITLDLKDLVRRFSKDDPVDANEFVNESIRLVLGECLATASPEAATKTTKSSVEAMLSTGANPLESLFKRSNSSTQLTSTAELIDAVGDKADKFDKFDAWLKQEIALAVRNNSDNIPAMIKFLDMESNQLDKLPTGFRLSIRTDRNAENFVNNLITGKSGLIRLTEIFLDVVNQMTRLGKAKKGVRSLLVGVGSIAAALGSAGVVAAAGGGIAESIMGEEVDELTATKLAVDVKIRSDAVKAFNSILIQEPDFDTFKFSGNMPFSEDEEGQFTNADNLLTDALSAEAGGDNNAVQDMHDAIEAYKAALGKKYIKPQSQDPAATNEHTINLISSLIREFLSHN